MSIYSSVHNLTIQPFIEKRNQVYASRHLPFLKECETFTKEQLYEYQWLRIKSIIKHAYQNTIFYKKRFDEINAVPDDIQTIEDFRMLPPVTRQDLNSQMESMTAQNIPEIERHSSTTGGSTGVATHFIRDNACLAIKKASECRFNTWAGWKPGEKILAYWPALADFSGIANSHKKFARSLLYSRHLQLFAGKLNEKILSEHVKAFKKFRPHLVRAFPSALQQFAEFVEGFGTSMPPPKAVICVGEPLIESQRALFKKVFSSNVYNCYVSRECGNIACECSFHSGLHVAEELI